MLTGVSWLSPRSAYRLLAALPARLLFSSTSLALLLIGGTSLLSDALRAGGCLVLATLIVLGENALRLKHKAMSGKVALPAHDSLAWFAGLSHDVRVVFPFAQRAPRAVQYSFPRALRQRSLAALGKHLPSN